MGFGHYNSLKCYLDLVLLKKMLLGIEFYSKAPHFVIFSLSFTPRLKQFLALSKNTLKRKAINEFL